MIESEWDNCVNCYQALNAVNRATSSANAGWRRKFRLFGCHALRRIAHHVGDSRFEHALDVAEQHFDGHATLAELRAAIANARHGYAVHGSDLPTQDMIVQNLNGLLADHPFQVAYQTSGAMIPVDSRQPQASELREATSSALAVIVREMFGNPFRPVALDPSWRSSTAVALARHMYESREFSAMPILADALQDAGCDNDDVLTHCRADGVHVRGCWVVDLVLGKA